MTDRPRRCGAPGGRQAVGLRLMGRLDSHGTCATLKAHSLSDRRGPEPQATMTSRTLRIAMNGITGRMGYPAAPRPLDPADPRPGQRDARGQDAPAGRTDPRRPQRGQGAGLAEFAQGRALDHRRRRAHRRPDVDIYFDAQVTSRRYAALTAAMKGRQAHLHGEAHGGAAGGSVDLARLRETTGITAGVVHDKALPSRAWSSCAGSSTRASSAGSCRCAASSATGCSRATCRRRSGRAGTIARRTAAASSSTCSATGTTCSRASSGR